MSVSLDVPPELNGLSGLYNTPDPLIRRLRIIDTGGQPILDVDKYFKDREVLIIYAGSEGGSLNLKELHRNLTSLALRKLKTCSILYISIDTDPESQKRITANVPWLRLEFCDNSDFAPVVTAKQGAKIVEIEDVARGEDFVQAGEIEVGAERVPFGVEEYQHEYVRPLSRAAVTALMQAYAAPSIAIYHIPSHSFIKKNVRMTALHPSKVNKNYQTWKNGGDESMRIKDYLVAMQWPLLFLFVALVYRLVVFYGGDQWNVIPKLVDHIGWRGSPQGKVL